jgi:hypothetical protein
MAMHVYQTRDNNKSITTHIFIGNIVAIFGLTNAVDESIRNGHIPIRKYGPFTVHGKNHAMQ